MDTVVALALPAVVIAVIAWGIGLLRAIPRVEAKERLRSYCSRD
jgi:hypothetical protein